MVEEFSHLRLAECTVLDIGASHLLIAREIAETGARVIGIDVDQDAIARGLAGSRGLALGAVAGSGEALPFKDGAFDLVICNHVYEHVRDPRMLVSEIRRVLHPDGICYFAGGHRYQLIEPHYRLPFLSWIPMRWADKWLKARGWEGYDIRFLDLPGLDTLLSPFRETRNLTSTLLSRADEFDLAPRWLARLFSTMPTPIRDLLARMAPTQIWLLRP